MKQTCILNETREVQVILNDAYDELLELLRQRNPKAESLYEAEDLRQLCELMAFVRKGYIRTLACSEDGTQKRFRILQVVKSDIL